MADPPLLFFSLFAKSLPPAAATSTGQVRLGKRKQAPRGLYRQRAAYVYGGRSFSPHESCNSDLEDEDEDDGRSVTSPHSKRRRTESPSTGPTDPLDLLCDTPLISPALYSPLLSDAPSPATGPQLSMDSILEAQSAKAAKGTCDHGDWEELKKWFAEAAEQYERDETTAAIALLRAVIQECHRFLTFYADPSVLFTSRTSSRRTGGSGRGSSPDVMTPIQESSPRDWTDSSHRRTHRQSPSVHQPNPVELPTAFHAILGITLFLFGNLVAQDASLVLPGEPSVPTTYWLAALDVFETGENLPCRTGGNTFGVEDWRMAIVWGRTLVCLAEEKITLMARAGPDSTPFSARIPVAEPRWPRDSIFHDIATRRPPVTRRTSLATATPNDLMVLAMDQFSRGIFHMPHPEYTHSHSHIFVRHAPPLPLLPQTLNPVSPDSLGFSRPKELFTIASEVISVAERLRDPDERKYWAVWADSVFNQMKMEADTGEWRSRITSSRGRCWLVAGSVRVDDLEDALERGDENVYASKDAIEAREGLKKAISFFEHAKGSSSVSELQELQPLFTEALLSLANLTADESEREELYSRAQAEGGDSIVLTMDPMSLHSNTSSEQVVYMDES